MAYDWRTDAIESWRFAVRCKALALGSVRFKTLWEMYYQESKGVIP